MDRKSRHLIVASAALLVGVASAFAQTTPNLRAASWIALDHWLEALSTEPVVDREVLFKAAIDAGMASSAEGPEDLRSDLLTGEFLFKAPLLLGGQAAKAGLSCHSCHVNGRGNPHFQFAAISGEPGTADTTHSFFSKSLGNQVFDPVAIPDLTQAGKVDHDPASGDLEGFITTIVVEEFSGSAEMSEVIGPLATYVRALRLSGPQAQEPHRSRSIKRDLDDVILTADQIAIRLAKREKRAASLLLSSAQSQLQDVYERMPSAKHAGQQRWLVERSREAGAFRQALDAGKDVPAELLADWREALSANAHLEEVEAETLYNPEILDRTLAQ